MIESNHSRRLHSPCTIRDERKSTKFPSTWLFIMMTEQASEYETGRRKRIYVNLISCFVICLTFSPGKMKKKIIIMMMMMMFYGNHNVNISFIKDFQCFFCVNLWINTLFIIDFYHISFKYLEVLLRYQHV